jgi:hypothetical protein
VQASASRVETSGRPDYVSVPLDRPELYFSEGLSGYAVVNNSFILYYENKGGRAHEALL